MEPGTAKSAGGSPISTKIGSASAAFVRRPPPLNDSDNCAVTRISQLHLRPSVFNVISRDEASRTFENHTVVGGSAFPRFVLIIALERRESFAMQTW